MNANYEMLTDKYMMIAKQMALTAEAKHDIETIRANTPEFWHFPSLEQVTNIIVDSQLLPAMLSIKGEVPSFWKSIINEFQNINHDLGEEVQMENCKMACWKELYNRLLRLTVDWINTVSMARPKMGSYRLLGIITIFASVTGACIRTVDDPSGNFMLKSIEQTIESKDGLVMRNDETFDIAEDKSV